MNLLDEMLAPKEVGDAVEGVVVDEDRAEQRLFGLEVVRRRAIGALLRLRSVAAANCSMVAMGVERVFRVRGVEGERKRQANRTQRAMIRAAAASDKIVACAANR